jgi:hypothetical protein
MKEGRLDSEYKLKIKSQKNEILSMLKPTEREKVEKKNLFEFEGENKQKIVRYFKLCDKLKGLLDNKSTPRKKKVGKISSPLQTYY